MTRVFKSQDQNGILLFGAIVNDLIIPATYTSKFSLLRRLVVLKNNGIYSNCIEFKI